MVGLGLGELFSRQLVKLDVKQLELTRLVGIELLITAAAAALCFLLLPRRTLKLAASGLVIVAAAIAVETLRVHWTRSNGQFTYVLPLIGPPLVVVAAMVLALLAAGTIVLGGAPTREVGPGLLLYEAALRGSKVAPRIRRLAAVVTPLGVAATLWADMNIWLSGVFGNSGLLRFSAQATAGVGLLILVSYLITGTRMRWLFPVMTAIAFAAVIVVTFVEGSVSAGLETLPVWVAAVAIYAWPALGAYLTALLGRNA